ncbi:hypothetical protein KFK09_013687 [Dendrobium nobile]|uniref:Retrovirus-related Pol polyprotein from transposon TNT 1-94 n=1 Tax=Dendrobium nobile TaxID=94219 RepID=A0A8T3B9W5_DENNO|nr:hypothetical protein KFK09_013687 [Dendrobium nobile]
MFFVLTTAPKYGRIARRLQSSTHSRTIQFRNELHHLSIKNQTMSQYLLAIKSLVDAIVATGSPLDPEEVIFYTLHGLPSQYQAFKIAIRKNLQPLSLDDLYMLLSSKELNLAQEAIADLQNLQLTDPSTVLATYHGRGPVATPTMVVDPPPLLSSPAT